MQRPLDRQMDGCIQSCKPSTWACRLSCLIVQTEEIGLCPLEESCLARNLGRI